MVEIVLVTGVFDILHGEHLKFLHQSRQLGTKLVVGLESDRRVKQMKGESRPILNQTERWEQLNNLPMVDEVFILPEQFDNPTAWKKLLIDVNPKYYAVSGNTSHLKSKQAICDECGVKLVEVLAYNPKISTSIIIERIKRAA